MYHADVTYWIDKQALVFLKIRRISDGSMMVSKNLHLPSHSEATETYPVAEIDTIGVKGGFWHLAGQCAMLSENE